MKVYIVGYEPISEKSSVGGFDWFYKKEDADECYDVEVTNGDSHTVYRGELEIGDATDKDDITNMVDSFLEQNGWDKAFDENDRFWFIELDPVMVKNTMLLANLNDEYVGLVDEEVGGVIGFINREHSDNLLKVLNK
jgi:hypothetical protein